VSIPVLVAITMMIFALTELAPGDPADYFISPESATNPELLRQLRAAMGLDASAPVRYVRWLGALLRGNMGYRLKNGDSVAEIIRIRLGATLWLVGAALVGGTVIGVFMGVFTALNRNTLWDYLLTGASFVGISMPAYIAALMGLYFFSVRLHLFPAGGMQTIGMEPNVADALHHLAMPSLTLSFQYMASNMRYTRSSMLDVMSENYIITARAKGMPIRLVVCRHALKNSLLPVITLLGLNLPNLAVGAVFVESIYSWPGMGSLYLDAIQSRDFPLIMGVNLVVAVLVVLASLLTDVLYAVADPRIRYD
jgi:peptide/nickel transport system permease protein